MIKKIFVRIGKGIKNKFHKDMKKGSSKREDLLLEEYEKGRVLEVDSGVNNKEFLKSGDCKKYKKDFKKPEEQNILVENSDIRIGKNTIQLAEEISILIKEKPDLKVKIYLRELLKRHKGNLDQENTRELIKKELEKK